MLVCALLRSSDSTSADRLLTLLDCSARVYYPSPSSATHNNTQFTQDGPTTTLMSVCIEFQAVRCLADRLLTLLIPAQGVLPFFLLCNPQHHPINNASMQITILPCLADALLKLLDPSARVYCPSPSSAPHNNPFIIHVPSCSPTKSSFLGIIALQVNAH